MMNTEKNAIMKSKSNRISNSRKTNLELFTMTIPGMLCIFLFCYLPMFGVVLAFKNFNYIKGIFGSSWVGFDNFMFFFSSNDAIRITMNTLGYNVFFIIIDLFCAVFIAIFLFDIKNKAAIKYYQTSMLLPHFVSWVIVGYVVYIFLNPSLGLVNRALGSLGINAVQWYAEPNRWQVILTICHEWKVIGVNCIIYYAVLMGMDMQIVEAARVDGANKHQQILHIMIPALVPTMIILTILSVGSIFRGDFGLFYQVPRDVGALYPTTDVIDTYIYRALQGGNIGMSSAVGLFQSVVGFVLVLVTNTIVKKIDQDKSLF